MLVAIDCRSILINTSFFYAQDDGTLNKFNGCPIIPNNSLENSRTLLVTAKRELLVSRAKIASSLTNLKCGVKRPRGEQARARIRIGAVVKELTLSSTERVHQSCRLRHQDSRWAGHP